MDFSRPGKPGDNAIIESFNRTFRGERLNVSWFLSMEDAREKIERWREEYNVFRPHSSLGGKRHCSSPDGLLRARRARKLPFWLDQFLGRGILGITDDSH